jgi:hypothetical protein
MDDGVGMGKSWAVVRSTRMRILTFAWACKSFEVSGADAWSGNIDGYALDVRDGM